MMEEVEFGDGCRLGERPPPSVTRSDLDPKMRREGLDGTDSNCQPYIYHQQTAFANRRPIAPTASTRPLSRMTTLDQACPPHRVTAEPSASTSEASSDATDGQNARTHARQVGSLRMLLCVGLEMVVPLRNSQSVRRFGDRCRSVALHRTGAPGRADRMTKDTLMVKQCD